MLAQLPFPNLGSGQHRLSTRLSAWREFRISSVSPLVGRLGIVLPVRRFPTLALANWRKEVVDVPTGSAKIAGGALTRVSVATVINHKWLGCSGGSTTPTRWRWWRSPDLLGRHMSPHQAVGVRRCRGPIQSRAGRGTQTQPQSLDTKGVAFDGDPDEPHGCHLSGTSEINLSISRVGRWQTRADPQSQSSRVMVRILPAFPQIPTRPCLSSMAQD